MLCVSSFFFFQAEDGIRDKLVTGVQTCALPIFAPPYIRRRDRFEVTERVDYAGNVVTPLDENEARALAPALRKRDVQTIAVCFINSYANPAHELRMRDILEDELPGGSAATPADLLP